MTDNTLDTYSKAVIEQWTGEYNQESRGRRGVELRCNWEGFCHEGRSWRTGVTFEQTLRIYSDGFTTVSHRLWPVGGCNLSHDRDPVTARPDH